MKVFSIIILLLNVSLHNIQAQELIKQPLNNEDLNRGVSAHYEYNATDSYGYIGVTLFKTGRYFYKTEAFGRSSYSEGTWVMKKDELVITSDIGKDDLPVKIDYISEVSKMDNKSIIGVVKNLKGEILTDALVYINNDTVQCFPIMDTCIGTYNNIDSLKVVFINGFSSNWLKIENKEFKQLQLKLQLDIKLALYEVFDKERYKVLKASILLIK